VFDAERLLSLQVCGRFDHVTGRQEQLPETHIEQLSRVVERQRLTSRRAFGDGASGKIC
jgi:hypothetical protein